MSDELDFTHAQYDRPRNENGLLAKSVLFGLVAAIVASFLYAAFTIASRLEFGIVAVAVGYMVGKAMMYGSNDRGGRSFQIAAVILTYFSVSFASVPELLWTLHKRGTDLGQITPRVVFILARYGAISPFMGLTHGINGFLSLFILFIGLRAAWRLTSANSGTSHHPFGASPAS